jgi:hypothetical protein
MDQRAVSRAARATALRLDADSGHDLLRAVEAALAPSSPRKQADQFVDAVALGSLIVSVAALAWTIIRDLRTKNQNPSTDGVIRQVRVELAVADQIPAETREKVIQAVVEELLADQD